MQSKEPVTVESLQKALLYERQRTKFYEDSYFELLKDHTQLLREQADRVIAKSTGQIRETEKRIDEINRKLGIITNPSKGLLKVVHKQNQ